MVNIKELLEQKEYDFLRENPHLKGKILFLCLGGSRAYGTDIQSSDIDIRGVCLPSESDLLGLTSFDVYTDSKTDTVIYSLPKFIRLASSCNPNIIEMLFCNNEHFYWVTPLGQKLIDNRKLFLTAHAKLSFGGYAQGLKALLTSNSKKIPPSIDKTMMHLIRIHLMENEILRTGDLHVYRGQEHDMLTALRNGKYREKDRTIKKEYFDLLESLEVQGEEYFLTTTLPVELDKKKVFELVSYIIRKGVFSEKKNENLPSIQKKADDE